MGISTLEIFAIVTAMNSIAILLLAATMSRTQNKIMQMIKLLNYLYLLSESEEVMIEFEADEDDEE